MLRKDDELKSCGVTDGCTIQVHEQVARRRKAQGQKDQQVELVSDTCPEMTQSQKDVVIQMLEGNEGYREIIKMISETRDEEHGMQCFKVLLQKE